MDTARSIRRRRFSRTYGDQSRRPWWEDEYFDAGPTHGRERPVRVVEQVRKHGIARFIAGCCAYLTALVGLAFIIVLIGVL